MQKTVVLLGILLLLFSPCLGQTATTRWGGRITDLSYSGQVRGNERFSFTIQNTGGGVESYRVNAFIIANNRRAQRQSFILSVIADKLNIGSLRPSIAQQYPLQFPVIAAQPNYSYTLVLELVEYGWPHWVIDRREYSLK